MKFRTLLAVGGFAAAIAFSGAAQAQVAVGGNIGTTGVGLQLSHPVSESVVVRGALDFISFDQDDTFDDLAYTGELKSSTAGVFADWHPGAGALFVSGGVYFGERKVTLKAVPTSAVDLGNHTYTPAQVGTLDGEAKMSDLQPFLGVGFDNTFSSDGAMGFRAMIGASFGDDPEVTLTCSGGTACAGAALQADLEIERQSISEDADMLKIYPVIQVGLTYKF